MTNNKYSLSEPIIRK